MANAEIVAIGSELLLGQIVDTNSAWMAQRLWCQLLRALRARLALQGLASGWRRGRSKC